MTGVLASQYACALADAIFPAPPELQPLEAVEQLRSAEALVSSSRQLRLALVSPTVAKEQKFAVIRQVADELGLHRVICNFLLLVASHRRTGELKKICTAFEEIVNERLGFVTADISSAKDLDAQRRLRIERAVNDKLGKPIRARYKVDPYLLGGIKASVASREYDGTIRGRLERLRAHLFANV
jgi:F-type H+-transporting ATPase subunit delta